MKKPNEYGLKVTPQDAQEAVDILEEYVKERAELLAKDKIHDAPAAVKFMAAIKDFTDMVQEKVKAPAEILYNTTRFSLVPNVFEATETEKITVPGVGRCHLQDDISCKVANKEGLHLWLTENGLEDIITEQVNAQTLAAHMRARIKENAAIAKDALKQGLTDPAKIQELMKALPPQTIVEIKPVVRAQITRE
jgi:hypothetical protein